MTIIDKLIQLLPEVTKPTEKRLPFSTKMKWTGIILVLYFILGQIELFGVAEVALEQFSSLAMILGAKFGTIISLGIGPIVTASIILQLLNGSGLFKFDTSSPEGKKKFQGIQKLTAFGFIIFEAIVYVMLGGLSPSAELAGTSIYSLLQFLIIIQLFLGGFMIMLMDDLLHKWGIGSGISLFIAAGVSQQIVVRLFSWVKPDGSDFSVGAVWGFFQAFHEGNMNYALLMLFGILATVLVFGLSIYAQAMKVEIPLSFGRVRGHGIRWPLNFLYTSNIPVILIAALLANIQIGAQLLSKVIPSLDAQTIQSWVSGPNILSAIIQSKSIFIGITPYLQVLVYLLIFLVGATVFSWFWVQTSGMDARSQAKNIMRSGLQIPGFRKDPRIMEKVLNRYIAPLTIMGAVTVAVLAVFADILGAYGSGTGILLTVMILYRFYEDIAKQHMEDFNPAMKGFFGG